jgi:anti-sigma B factor antagonist
VDDLKHYQRDGVTVIKAGEDLDIYTSADVREFLLELDGSARVVIDMTATTFVDVTGLGVLLGGVKRARAQGGALAVACTSEPVLRAFRKSGMTEVLAICPTVGEAVASLPPDRLLAAEAGARRGVPEVNGRVAHPGALNRDRPSAGPCRGKPSPRERAARARPLSPERPGPRRSRR